MRLKKNKKGFNKMAKVKIGKKEYDLYLLNMDEVKALLRKLDDEKTQKLIKDNYDRTSFILAEAINKCNPEAKLTIELWDKAVTVDIFEELQSKIMDLTGLKTYFKVGIGKK